eukprot:TRINITY_DN4126_c0_g1_i1.p1 TRINITY_DN4126_c0_g1~~TRINITY_DN4126_c0_g1_i1.p1  ORF type:complete len:589 (-),score=50.06 TRINITY_DN4126_c0_g1_i1:177-1943(-)
MSGARVRQLHITVKDGEGFAPSLHNNPSDLIVRLVLGRNMFVTRELPRQANPQWHESCSLPASEVDELIVEVLEADGPGTEEQLGSARIRVEQLRLEHGPREQSFALLNNRNKSVGQIRLAFRGEFSGIERAGSSSYVPSNLSYSNGHGLSLEGGQRVNVRIVQAVDLRNTELAGSADPFAELVTGSEVRRTATNWGTVLPVWDEEFPVDVHPGDVITVRVRDENRMLRDELMGEGSVAAEQLVAAGEKWIPLQRKGQSAGKVLLSVRSRGRTGTIAPTPQPHRPIRPAPHPSIQRPPTRISPVDPPSPVHLTITAVGAEDLPVAHSTGARTDPYLELKCGTISRRTETRRNTATPLWRETFQFETTSNATVYATVRNADTGENIAHGVLPISEMKPHDGFEIEVALSTATGAPAGLLRLQPSFNRPAPQPQFVPPPPTQPVPQRRNSSSSDESTGESYYSRRNRRTRLAEAAQPQPIPPPIVVYDPEPAPVVVPVPGPYPEYPVNAFPRYPAVPAPVPVGQPRVFASPYTTARTFAYEEPAPVSHTTFINTPARQRTQSISVGSVGRPPFYDPSAEPIYVAAGGYPY